MIHIILVIVAFTFTVSFLSYYHDCISKSLCEKKLRKDDVKSLVYASKEYGTYGQGKKNKRGKNNRKNQYKKKSVEQEHYGKKEEVKQHYGKNQEMKQHYGKKQEKSTSFYGKNNYYNKTDLCETKTKCEDKGCVKPEFVFCNTQSCFEEDKCGTVCGIKCANGPYINKNCVPCPDLVERITRVINDLDCTKEKIIEQFSRGQCTKAKNLKLEYLKDLKAFVDLFDAIKLDKKGKEIMLCHFIDLEKPFFEYVNLRVQRSTVKIDCEKDRKEWLDSNKISLDKLGLEMKEAELKFAKTLHTILPTLGSEEDIRDYIHSMGQKLVKIAMLELSCEDKTKEIMDLTHQRRNMREDFARQLSKAMACTTCNG